MGTRRQAREWALQALYLSDSNGVSPEAAFKMLKKDLEHLGPIAGPFAKSLFEGALAGRAGLDEKIQACADNWEIDRMSAVDRNILRLAAFELLGGFDTPVSVVIDEALEIAKKYSTADSARFINGVLDKVKGYKQAAGK